MVERTPGFLRGPRSSMPADINEYRVNKDLLRGRPSVYGGTGSMIGDTPRRQYEQMAPNPMYNRNLWTQDTTATGPGGYFPGQIKANLQFPNYDRDRRRAQRRERGLAPVPQQQGFGGIPGMDGGGQFETQLRTPGGAEFHGPEMVDIMFEDFRVKKQMDPVMADLFKTQMDYELSQLKFGSDERINTENVQAALERAELEASLERERQELTRELSQTQDALERYKLEDAMVKLEFQAGEARNAQAKDHEASMSQLTLRESGETERAAMPFEAAREKRDIFMPLLMSLLGGGSGVPGGMGGSMFGGGRGSGGGMRGEVGPNRASNMPSFEGVLRRGVNDIVGNTMANRDAAMLSGTASQTGPEGGLGGETTANYLGPLAQHSAISGATGGINELLQNLLQYNLGSRQATSQTLGALAPYVT